MIRHIFEALKSLFFHLGYNKYFLCYPFVMSPLTQISLYSPNTSTYKLLNYKLLHSQQKGNPTRHENGPLGLKDYSKMKKLSKV